MKSLFEAARQQLSYTLSLPERTIRSLAALIGGVATLLADTFFPASLRGSTTYNIFIGRLLQFLVERVAQIEQEGEAKGESSQAGADYIQRKMVGTVVEAVGLLTIRFSPLWVFAIAGDVAGGSKVFLDRLVKHLKRNQVVSAEAKVTGLVDLLEAIQTASGQSATAIDIPPLSRSELAELVADLNENYRRVFAQTTDLIPRLETIWSNMERLSRREHISMARLSGLMTVGLLMWGRKGAGMTIATGHAGAELLNEHILSGYQQVLETIARQGVDEYVRSYLKPFLHAAMNHFDPRRKTWTESLLSGGENV